VIFYFLPAGLVFAFCATKLIQDPSTKTSNVEIWLFITLAALLWPMTGPSILRRQVLNVRNHRTVAPRSLYDVPQQWLNDDLANSMSL
jgi:hypothetical protein